VEQLNEQSVDRYDPDARIREMTEAREWLLHGKSVVAATQIM
jgi:hypothetical protein